MERPLEGRVRGGVWTVQPLLRLLVVPTVGRVPVMSAPGAARTEVRHWRLGLLAKE
jgi:hypothetical protein